MDFFFTKRELSWLDDLMPESKKKKLEDAEKEVGRDFTFFWRVVIALRSVPLALWPAVSSCYCRNNLLPLGNEKVSDAAFPF